MLNEGETLSEVRGFKSQAQVNNSRSQRTRLRISQDRVRNKPPSSKAKVHTWRRARHSHTTGGVAPSSAVLLLTRIWNCACLISPSNTQNSTSTLESIPPHPCPFRGARRCIIGNPVVVIRRPKVPMASGCNDPRRHLNPAREALARLLANCVVTYCAVIQLQRPL